MSVSHKLAAGMCLKNSSDVPMLVSQNKQSKLFVKTDGEIVIIGPKGAPIWSTRKLHTRVHRITNAGPFRLCLKDTGNLVQYNSKDELVWQTDTAMKGNGPFELLLNDNGVLLVASRDKMLIWSSAFKTTCDSARALYTNTYRVVAASRIDPWTHYVKHVLSKPNGKKEKFVWAGPKCTSCEQAKDLYRAIYPDSKSMDPAAHYLTIGRKQNRMWTSKLSCINSLAEGAVLDVGKSLISSNAKYRFTNQPDGNLVIVSIADNKVWWSLRKNETTRFEKKTGSYKLKMNSDGTLVYEGQGDVLWKTDSDGKADRPYTMTLTDKGFLQVTGGPKGIQIWTSIWAKQCEPARQWYCNKYKEVAQANIDPWIHYTENVLTKPSGQKGQYIWPGPKCETNCEDAKGAYHHRYPEVQKKDAALHFLNFGGKENRIWKGTGDMFRCINAVVSPGYIIKNITSNNGLFMASLNKFGIINIRSEISEIWNHTQLTTRRPGKGPYSLQLQNDGNLVARNADGSIYWDTNTANMGHSPYKLIVTDKGHLRIDDQRGVTVWTTRSDWENTCGAAQIKYKEEYKGTWNDFIKSLRETPQEKRVWRGPRCEQCSDAYKRYLVEYPDIKQQNLNAAEHFVKTGKYQGRIWTGANDCWKQPIRPATTIKPTSAPAPPASTPKPTTTVIDGNTYKLCTDPKYATVSDEFGRNWGTENNETCVVPK